MKKIIKVTFIQLVVFFFLVEIIFTILSEASVIYIGKPSYSIEQQKQYYTTGPEGGGRWRTSNTEYRHSSGCFDVTYSTNSYGARDAEREVDSDDARVIVLGDSFVEGWGIQENKRFTNLLELNSSIEFMNFGISGVGLTQELFVYKDFAQKFSHDAVLLMLFPYNDFYDDNPENAQYHTQGLEPFLKGVYPDYSIAWEGTDKDLKKNEDKSLIKRIIKNFSYSYKVFRYIKGRQQLKNLMRDNNGVDRPYFEMTEDEWLRMKYLIAELKGMMGERELFVVTIPDIYASQRVLNSDDQVLLRDSLNVLSHQLGFKYHDLLSEISPNNDDNWFDLYFDCDEHWNEKGNFWAAEKLDSVFDFRKSLLQ